MRIRVGSQARRQYERWADTVARAPVAANLSASFQLALAAGACEMTPALIETIRRAPNFI